MKIWNYEWPTGRGNATLAPILISCEVNQVQQICLGNFKTNVGKLICLEFSGYSTVLNSNQAWFTVNWQFPRCVVKVCCENVTGSKNWIGHFLVLACSIPSIFFSVFSSVFPLYFLCISFSISSVFSFLDLLQYFLCFRHKQFSV